MDGHGSSEICPWPSISERASTLSSSSQETDPVVDNTRVANGKGKGSDGKQSGQYSVRHNHSSGSGTPHHSRDVSRGGPLSSYSNTNAQPSSSRAGLAGVHSEDRVSSGVSGGVRQRSGLSDQQLQSSSKGPSEMCAEDNNLAARGMAIEDDAFGEAKIKNRGVLRRLFKTSRGSAYQMYRWLPVQINFYQFLVTYIIVISLVAAGIVNSFTPGMPYLDCLFMCVSVLTNTGLATVAMNDLNDRAIPVFFCLMILGTSLTIQAGVLLFKRCALDPNTKHSRPESYITMRAWALLSKRWSAPWSLGRSTPEL